MAEHWELMHSDEVRGFDIALHFGPEYDDPRGHFASGDYEADAEIVRKIEDGTYLWFCARVTASREGVVLGTDYLGGCCYESVADFIASDGYYPDMVGEAISEARAKLANLCECVA